MDNQKNDKTAFIINVFFYTLIICGLNILISYFLLFYLLIPYGIEFLIIPICLVSFPTTYIPLLSKYFPKQKSIRIKYLIVATCVSIIWISVFYFKGLIYSLKFLFIGSMIILALMVFDYKKIDSSVKTGDKNNVIQKHNGLVSKILFWIIIIALAFFMAQRDTKPKWSDLSDKEKANAEFAYEVKQYQKEYEKKNKK